MKIAGKLSNCAKRALFAVRTAVCGLILLALAALAHSGAEAAPAPVRIAYNYCTLSYTFAYYSDAEWDAEIDRIAKAGYNVALVTDGTFKVWQATLRDFGVPEREIAKFIPDECARAWWLMDNLYGEGGPLDQKTIDEDGERGRRICEKMREKGIEPILQGFFGMWIDSPGVNIDALRVLPQGGWQCYKRPPVVDPTCPAFATLAAAWYRNLEATYGFKPKYLAGDLFHEGGRSKGVDVTAAARAVQKAQQEAFPGATWVVQAWGPNPTPALRAGLDPRFTLVEALVPQMDVFAGDDSSCDIEFGDLPWVWCEVLNFGGKFGMHGNLKTFARLGRAAKGKGAKTFRGYGSLSEGFFTNPVCYDLFEEMMMRDAGAEMTDAELAGWLDAWVGRRYGMTEPDSAASRKLREAWRILAGTVYACPQDYSGPFENLMCANPAWDVKRASTWGPETGPWYDGARLEKALDLMKEVCGACDSDNLKYDIYDLERQVQGERFRKLLPGLKKGDTRAKRECAALFGFICGRPVQSVPAAFRLATYENRARARAGLRGARAWRRMITTWSDARFGRSSLADYAMREYAELMSGYYIPRWRAFLGNPDGGSKPVLERKYSMGDTQSGTRTEKLRAKLDSQDRDYVFVTMHRGDWRHAPENSVDAIKGAIAMGADIVELDVALTKDGEYVLLHDGALDRVSNGKGKSLNYTLSEIKKFRLKGTDGKTVTDYEILTLREALALTKGKILVNLDKFPRDPEGIAAYVKRLGMEKEVILKGSYSPGELKKAMKDQWKSVEDGTFCFMPILWLNYGGKDSGNAGAYARKTKEASKKSIAVFEQWQKEKHLPAAYELCIPREKPVEVLERLKAMQKDGGPRIWINTLWDSLCAGHTDERGFNGDPDGSWGWALDQGATMIQTDRPAELIKYLEEKGRRNL